MLVAGGSLCAGAPAGGPARGLSSEEALARAAQSRFEITAIPREIQAGEGRILQAAVKPGARLDLETRNVFEESKVELIFPHERGGKRDARVASARAGLELVGAQAEVDGASRSAARSAKRTQRYSPPSSPSS